MTLQDLLKNEKFLVLISWLIKVSLLIAVKFFPFSVTIAIKRMNGAGATGYFLYLY